MQQLTRSIVMASMRPPRTLPTGVDIDLRGKRILLTAARTRPVHIDPRMAVTARALDVVAPGWLNSILKRQNIQPS